jgi:hypothetical protein
VQRIKVTEGTYQVTRRRGEGLQMPSLLTTMANPRSTEEQAFSLTHLSPNFSLLKRKGSDFWHGRRHVSTLMIKSTQAGEGELL